MGTGYKGIIRLTTSTSPFPCPTLPDSRESCNPEPQTRERERERQREREREREKERESFREWLIKTCHPHVKNDATRSIPIQLRLAHLGLNSRTPEPYTYINTYIHTYIHTSRCFLIVSPGQTTNKRVQGASRPVPRRRSSPPERASQRLGFWGLLGGFLRAF